MPVVTALQSKRKAVTSVTDVTAKRTVRRPSKAADQQLASDVRNAYNRWVVFHSDLAKHQAVAMTLWTFHTHVFDIADFTPYILVTAPTSEAGKSRVFDVARKMVARGFVVVDPTPAALFSVIELIRPTLMCDEADMIRESKQLRAVLNSGFQPGTPIVRARKVYDCFVPKIFSGISGERPPLTEATLSRCIQISIRRKSAEESVERFIPRQAATILNPIHARLEEWALRAHDKLATAIPKRLPKELSDRQRDMWGPLFAIADLLGGTWPKMARDAAVALSKAIPKAPDPAVQVLSDVKRVLDEAPGNTIQPRKLAEQRNSLQNPQYEGIVSPIELGRRLAGFGIYSEVKRDGKTTVRVFTFRRNGAYTRAWADAFKRYGV